MKKTIKNIQDIFTFLGTHEVYTRVHISANTKSMRRKAQPKRTSCLECTKWLNAKSQVRFLYKQSYTKMCIQFVLYKNRRAQYHIKY